MKKNNILHSEKFSSTQLAENILREYKKKIGEVVYVAINARTIFEFPVNLSLEEREIRIEKYKKRHNL